MGPYRTVDGNQANNIKQLQKDSITKRHKWSKTYPSTAQSVQVRATDTTVSDLDIDIGLLPGLRLEFLPDHFSLASLGAEAHPTFELVIGAHGDIEVNGIQLQNDLPGSPVRHATLYIQAIMIDPVSESSRKTRFVMLWGHRVGC